MTEELSDQLHQQAEALYNQYGVSFERDLWGQYVVISPDGETVIAPTLIEAALRAAATLGRGAFAFRIGDRSVASWK